MKTKGREIFLISPAGRLSLETREKIERYVAHLEAEGCDVHWPLRDTRPDNSDICLSNLRQIMERPEIHIWYNEKNGYSKFDMGALLMLVEVLKWDKKVVLANREDVFFPKEESLIGAIQKTIERQSELRQRTEEYVRQKNLNKQKTKTRL